MEVWEFREEGNDVLKHAHHYKRGGAGNLKTNTNPWYLIKCILERCGKPGNKLLGPLQTYLYHW